MKTKQPGGSTLVLFLIICALNLASSADAQVFERLYSFTNGVDGIQPYAPLMQARDGNFYGTADGGGNSSGTVFRLTPGGTFTVLATFTGSNGSNPLAGLVQAPDGNLYGTTQSGGSGGWGTVFRITTNGTFESVASLDYSSTGGWPQATLVNGSNGNLYGISSLGGGGGGAVYSLVTNSLSPVALMPGWARSSSELIQATDGNLYGTGRGTGSLFRVTLDGTVTLLASLNRTNTADFQPGVIQGTDGFLYGTTTGTTGDVGTVFRATLDGQVTTLAHFYQTNGNCPLGVLLQARDGNFYGTTFYGGDLNYGLIFRMTPDGTLSTVASLTSSTGMRPFAGLIQANDGNLYGTALAGGTSFGGTIFRIVMPAIKTSVSGNQLRVSWPTNQAGFTLQSSSDLSSATNWLDCTNLPGITGTEYVVSNDFSGNAQFFRLKK